MQVSARRGCSPTSSRPQRRSRRMAAINDNGPLSAHVRSERAEKGCLGRLFGQGVARLVTDYRNRAHDVTFHGHPGRLGITVSNGLGDDVVIVLAFR
jgi:hypothetical protein